MVFNAIQTQHVDSGLWEIPRVAGAHEDVESTRARVNGKPPLVPDVLPAVLHPNTRNGVLARPKVIERRGSLCRCVVHVERRVQMARYAIVSITSGLLFGAMDALINANPLAQRLHEVYRPISKASINVVAGISVDLVYGFIMAGAFLLLYQSLPGETGLLKGISFALMVWFFRVVMSVASQWVTFNVPAITLIYALSTGFFEMLILGVLYGWALKP